VVAGGEMVAVVIVLYVVVVWVELMVVEAGIMALVEKILGVVT